jgi:hypothetical protein
LIDEDEDGEGVIGWHRDVLDSTQFMGVVERYER